MADKKFLQTVYGLETSEDTQEFYADWASTYDEEVTENGYASPARVALALQKSGANLDAPLLDIGCGTGVSGLFLSQIGFAHIDVSDFTPNMLERAREK